MSRTMFVPRLWWTVALLLGLALPTVVQGQTGQLVGAVTNGQTGQPMGTVQMSLQGTQLGGLTNAEGRYTLTNIPVGTYTLVAQRLGFQQVTTQVTVTAGGTTTVDVQLQQAVLQLQGIVAAGLIDPVEGVRSPISVARVDRSSMPAMVGGADVVQNLQGAVAGLSVARQSGAPGQDSFMKFRSVTSVMSGSFPLMAVDGVILNGGSTNIESQDIESIEVVKGAAAASLYGSRAAAGVIVITTRRGQNLEQGQTRFSLRSEYGQSWLTNIMRKNQHHPYLMNADQTEFVDVNGAVVDRTKRVAPAAHLQFADNPWPGQIFDNVGNIYGGGSFSSQSFSMMQNAATTNFALALNQVHEGGILEGNDGYERLSYRLNLDHRFLEDFALSVSTFHSRDVLDNPKVDLFDVFSAPLDVDLRLKDENGEYLQIPDPSIPFQNPLWTEGSRDDERKRVRTLASANLSWEPLAWMSFMGNVSYDREDGQTRQYVAKGTPLGVGVVDPSDGSLSYSNLLNDAFNGEAQVSLRRDIGLLNIRTTVRGLVERTSLQRSLASGQDFHCVPKMVLLVVTWT